MLNSLTAKKNIRSFSLSAENMTGEKGKGAMMRPEEGTAHIASRELGVGWKVNPCLEIAAKGLEKACENPAIASGVNCYLGKLTNKNVSEALGYEYTELSSLIG